jgi:hypothetical protein
MGLIAIVGLSLPPFLTDLWLGVLGIASTLIVLPVVIAALVAADSRSARSVGAREARAADSGEPFASYHPLPPDEGSFR